jgi:hypothetical protein
MSAKHVVVTVDEKHLPEIRHVAAKLRSKGMQVDEIMEAIGMICGSYADNAADLQAVQGVASVEEPAGFDLPSPDSPIQ